MLFEAAYLFCNELSEIENDYLGESEAENNISQVSILQHLPNDSTPILLKNNENVIVAVLLTKIHLKCIFIELLWVNKNLKKEEIATVMQQEIVQLANNKNCKFVYLDSQCFETSEFYKRKNHKSVDNINGSENGPIRYFISKNIV
jgi:hypothetical protein